MGNVLYIYEPELSIDINQFIPLIVGIILLFISIFLFKWEKIDKEIKKTGYNLYTHPWFKGASAAIGILFIIYFLCVGISSLNEPKVFEARLKNGEVCEVTGYVEKLHTMPYEGKDYDHFEINGVYFEYSDYEFTNGYNKTASHGGVITENGQFLKIKYIPSEDTLYKQNIILYIEEL